MLTKREYKQMTRVKLCGMMRPEDIQAVNEIKPEYIGFVFAKKSRRYVSKAVSYTHLTLPTSNHV